MMKIRIHKKFEPGVASNIAGEKNSNSRFLKVLLLEDYGFVHGAGCYGGTRPFLRENQIE